MERLSLGRFPCQLPETYYNSGIWLSIMEGRTCLSTLRLWELIDFSFSDHLELIEQIWNSLPEQIVPQPQDARVASGRVGDPTSGCGEPTWNW